MIRRAQRDPKRLLWSRGAQSDSTARRFPVISVPVSASGEAISVNGTMQSGDATEDGKRKIVVLKTAGHFELLSR
jgi:hypothetical protein